MHKKDLALNNLPRLICDKTIPNQTKPVISNSRLLHDIIKHLPLNGDVRGCPRGVMVKAMDCGIVVREFVLQSRCYIHFRANTLGKGMNPLILPAMG